MLTNLHLSIDDIHVAQYARLTLMTAHSKGNNAAAAADTLKSHT
jgi:hypothetical protein